LAIIRRQNWLGQQRVDVPHLRSIESAIAADFDLLAGEIIANQSSYIVRGFEVIGDVGDAAESLQLNVSASVAIHYNGTESGSIFSVPSGTAAETLNGTNAVIVGAFTPSQTNYIGIDLIRESDDTTSDLVAFQDPNTLLETTRTVPLARTLGYRIYISTIEFSGTPTILPIAKVVTNASNVVTSIQDARPLLCRLGEGGTIIDNQHVYSWSQGRDENDNTNIFQGGDKSITGIKYMFDAMMTRLWEVGGGEFWYSATSDRDIKVCYGPVSTLDDNYSWNLGAQNIKWEGISISMANSTAIYNVVTDNEVAGLTLLDGQCIYVDIDRTANSTLTVPAAVDLELLGSPTVPGSRFILAWRKGNNVYTRDRAYEVGRDLQVASDAVGSAGLGVVRLSYAAGSLTAPTVAPIDADGMIFNEATANNKHGFSGLGHNSGHGINGEGGGGAGSCGVYGLAGASDGYGGYFLGTTSGNGTYTSGGDGDGAAAGSGLIAVGGPPTVAQNIDAGHGISCQGGHVTVGDHDGGTGIIAIGGQKSGAGTDGKGIYAQGGGASGTGGYFINGSTSGVAVQIEANNQGSGLSIACSTSDPGILGGYGILVVSGSGGPDAAGGGDGGQGIAVIAGPGGSGAGGGNGGAGGLGIGIDGGDGGLGGVGANGGAGGNALIANAGDGGNAAVIGGNGGKGVYAVGGNGGSVSPGGTAGVGGTGVQAIGGDGGAVGGGPGGAVGGSGVVATGGVGITDGGDGVVATGGSAGTGNDGTGGWFKGSSTAAAGRAPIRLTDSAGALYTSAAGLAMAQIGDAYLCVEGGLYYLVVYVSAGSWKKVQLT
jgi:hypothetical protein